MNENYYQQGYLPPNPPGAPNFPPPVRQPGNQGMMAPPPPPPSPTTTAFYPRNPDVRPDLDLTFAMKLKQNKGKRVKVYLQINQQLSGVIESCEKDFLILYNPDSRVRTIIMLKEVVYVEFLDEIRMN